MSLNPKSGGIYIHIPYCRKKCLYCDFFSGGSSIAKWGELSNALLREIESRINELTFIPKTLYIGGGTPSIMPTAIFSKLILGIKKHIPAIEDIEEFTIEVNPEDVTEYNLKLWKDTGVNRISMGIQSLDDDILRFLCRNHDSNTAIKAAELLSANFDNVNFDVMFGIPGQTIHSLEDTLSTLFRLNPSHLSAYSLMYEDNTAMTTMLKRGNFREVAEEVSIQMYELISETSESNGLRQYEISNYAVPGKESKHNSAYWDFSPYIGIGPSAHSYDGVSKRRANENNIKRYLTSGGKPAYYEETLNEEEKYEEYIMLRLRTREGINLTDMRSKFGEERVEGLKNKALRYAKSGNIKLSPDTLSLTKEGVMRADTVIVSLL